MTNPLEVEVAKAEGKHSEFYSTYISKTDAEIQKAIRSLTKRIAKHQRWIQNPEQYIPNFSSLDPRQQRALDLLRESLLPAD